VLDDIVPHDIAQGISVQFHDPELPAAAMGRDRQPPPRASTGLAPLVSEQTSTPDIPAFVATRSCVNNGRIRA